MNTDVKYGPWGSRRLPTDRPPQDSNSDGWWGGQAEGDYLDGLYLVLFYVVYHPSRNSDFDSFHIV